MAFASIFVPHFMLHAVVRTDPALWERALVLIDGNPPSSNVVAVNERAARMGIEPGMAKANAAQFAGVEIRPRSRAQEIIAHAALLDIGWSVSPRIEDAAENAIVLDLAGLTGMFGSEKDIGTRLDALSTECGLSSHIAIAANIDTAQIAARGFPGITVIPPGQESPYLSGLPVSVLSPSAEMAETLGRWGVRTCADFVNLPVLQLSERLGQEGVRLHALARGESSRSLAIAEAKYFFEEEMELDDPVEELDPLSFLLGRLLDQLCARLAARSLAAAAIRVRFELQPSFENAVNIRKDIFREKNPPGWYEKELQLSLPTHDSKMLLKLLRLRLQRNPPNTPIQKIAIAAHSARPRATQGGLFRPNFPDPEKLELTVARISHVVGETNVGSPLLMDTHRPAEFQMQRFFTPVETGDKNRRHKVSIAAPSDPERQSANSTTPVSFRVFRPPVPVKIESKAGCPTRVAFRGLSGEVSAASGPWRTSGEWWQENSWQQEEWDLEIHFHPSKRSDPHAKCDPNCGLYLLYYDPPRGSWFARGIYD
jgi:protein ImuB